ncbi:hypothetical protein Q5Y75_06645 [Ruegeria sp. 2205SS24-7]|uniref:hypothetical protein n=1 Tax=Ruegeria discodermiae TaxID=3064389 RepID=UPI002740588F|nr:hypothetical protein [Ruegeria sp. 2205SS24-7]MDP5216890.1 hypothetical protein [Ruegeria sp. 2205SS24-7]
MSRLDMKAAKRRVKEIAEMLDVSAPAELTDAEGAPTDELLQFTHDTGASLDFIFLGCTRGMHRAMRDGKPMPIDPELGDPVCQLMREYEAIRAGINGYGGDIPVESPLNLLWQRIEREVTAATAQTLEGIAAHVRFAASEGVELDRTYAGEGRTLYHSIQRGLNALRKQPEAVCNG